MRKKEDTRRQIGIRHTIHTRTSYAFSMSPLCTMGFTKPRRRLSTLVPSLSLSLSLFAFKEFHWPIIALAGSLRR